MPNPIWIEQVQKIVSRNGFGIQAYGLKVVDGPSSNAWFNQFMLAVPLCPKAMRALEPCTEQYQVRDTNGSQEIPNI